MSVTITEINPSGTIDSVSELGVSVRDRRKAQGATQAQCAALCGVGVRFISELENGKATMELGKVLHVLKCLGLELSVRPRGWPADQGGRAHSK
ncbi:MAG: helix-turn-helix transcriptional regulator [Gammaproteobacteria bacterium]